MRDSARRSEPGAFASGRGPQRAIENNAREDRKLHGFVGGCLLGTKVAELIPFVFSATISAQGRARHPEE